MVLNGVKTGIDPNQRNGLSMRVEIENLASEIKQSLELLRRHL